MNIMSVWTLILIIAEFCFAIKDFKKSDRGIGKDLLHSKYRIKWQKRNAFLQLGISIFGALAMLSEHISVSYHILMMKWVFLVFGAITILLIILFLINVNDKTIMKALMEESRMNTQNIG